MGLAEGDHDTRYGVRGRARGIQGILGKAQSELDAKVIASSPTNPRSGPLDDCVIIVTGAAGGIGSATASLLAEAGAHLVISDISEKGGEIASAIVKNGGRCVFVKADVGEEADAEALVDSAVSTYGRLDGAFNNAGVEQSRPPPA